jgi:hypothetical protein
MHDLACLNSDKGGESTLTRVLNACAWHGITPGFVPA